MVIEQNFGNKMLINDIKIGECFIDNNNLCIKIFNENPHEYFKHAFLDFKTNVIDALPDGAEVMKVNGKIVIY